MENKQKPNIEESNIKVIFITNINNLLYDFFKTIKVADMGLYFMNKDIKPNANFNDWVITNLSNEKINFLKINIDFASKRLEYLDPSLKNSNANLDCESWKICVFSEMFFNLPFTLQDVIFIPESYINSSMEKFGLLDFMFAGTNKVNKNFSRTLVHEKIHLLQRYNQSNWDNYIIDKTNWIIVNNPIVFNFTLINNNKIIYNPDTHYVKNIFAYPSNDKYYHGQMLLNSKREIKNIWYVMVDSDNEFYLYPISHSVTKYEHPYEELAYNLSNDLI
jgi:hypothetical protein